MDVACFPKLLNDIIAVISIITVLYAITLLPRHPQATPTIKKQKKDASVDAQRTITLIAWGIFFIIFVISIIYFIWYKKLLNSVPINYIRLLSIFISLIMIGWSPIKNLITSNESTPLSDHEHYLIFVLASLFLCLAPRINSIFTNNFVLSTSFAGFFRVVCLCLFFSSSLFLITAISLILLNKIAQTIKYDSFLAKHEKSPFYLIRKQIESLNNPTHRCSSEKKENSDKLLTRFGFALKFAKTALIDIICYLFRIFLFFISAIPLLACQFILITFYFIIKFLKKIPIRETIVLSLRLAIVFGVTSVVVFLHIYYSTEETGALISIVEFIASVIVIPVVFQWIQSYYENKRAKDQKNMCTEKCCCKERSATSGSDATI